MDKKQILKWSMIAVMALAASCNKDPIPEPQPNPQPNDTIPTVPNDTIVPINHDTITPPPPSGDTILPQTGKIAEFYYEGGVVFPSLDSIMYYADNPLYDSIKIYARAPCQAWTPIGFHAARDSLSKRFDVSPKVRGGWWWTPYQILPDIDSTNMHVKGMIRSDSAWYKQHHYDIFPQVTKSVRPTHYNGTQVFKSGRSR